MNPIPTQDVLILGGGLAGLTLALQLRKAHPDLRIGVIERRAHPVPEAAFKIGESTVEIAAHYFGDVLGLRAHLDERQIVKFGFRFFFSDGSTDIANCVELGASMALKTGAWQIDRGRFENFLGEQARLLGIDLITEAKVMGVDLSDDESAHIVRWEHAGTGQRSAARWVVDASGRASIIKRKLGLAKPNGHHANAVWFRVKGRIDIDEWATDADWLSRCSPPERWRSTNHLVGAGYWVWLIPLSSGSHSVGIVCDADAHPIEGMKTFDLSMQWLQTHQPRLAQALDPMRDELQDFAYFRDFSYSCTQVFSEHRWALTGEAGAFLDPFYSPGSDFIAISNTYITSLISKDRAGEAWQPYASVYQQLFMSFYDSTMAMYRGQYHLFGDAQVLPLKVLWDYTYYWGVLAPLFFADRIADMPTMSRLRPELARAMSLNVAMQKLFAEWGHLNTDHAHRGRVNRFLDQASVDWFAELNRALKDSYDARGFREQMRKNVRQLAGLARELSREARQHHPSLDDAVFDESVGEADAAEASEWLPAHWHVGSTIKSRSFDSIVA